MSKRLFASGMMAICAVAWASNALAQTQQGDRTEPLAVANTSFAVMSIQHLPVEEADAMISQMFPNKVVSSPLPSTNQLIVRADDETIEVIQALLLKVDKKASRAEAYPYVAGALQLQYPQSATPDEWQPLSVSLVHAEQQARDIAEELRSVLSTMGEKHPQVVKLRAEFEDRVDRLFQQRQVALRDRIQQLGNKLQMLREKVEQREQSRKRMVEQRVEQLLSGHAPSQVQRPRSPKPPSAPSVGADFTMTLDAPHRDGPLNLLAQLAETQNRIAKAEAEAEAATAEYERAKHQFEVLGPARPDQVQLETTARVHLARRKAALAEVEAAKKMYRVVETQVATHRDLLRNDVQQAEISLSKAQRDLERAASLRENKAISSSEMDSIQTALERARLKFERAKKILDAFQEQAE